MNGKHVRCLNHVIHLVVSDFLGGILSEEEVPDEIIKESNRKLAKRKQKKNKKRFKFKRI